MQMHTGGNAGKVLKMNESESNMIRIIKLNDNRSVTVVSEDSSHSVISDADAEMDARAKEAVKSAINRAKICNKPIAGYDRASRRAYIKTSDGKKTYV